MQLSVYKDGAALARAAAEQIIRQVIDKPSALLCLAGGETPRATYGELAAIAYDRKIDFSNIFFVGLDEWMGIPPENSGSCYYFLQETVFRPLGIPSDRICFFNGLTTNEQEECKRVDQFIETRGGIDLMLVGIGMNGHIGFNEPGFSPTACAHVRELDNITQQVGQKYFSSEAPLSRGITLGMQQFMDAGQVMLLATGHKKAPIVQQALGAEIGIGLPGSFIRLHKNGFVLLDEAAAGDTAPVAG